MAFELPSTPENKKTGFTYKGKGIVLSKTQGRPLTDHYKLGWYPDTKRIEVCTLYAVLGSVKKVSDLTDVSVDAIRKWRTEEWFKEMLEEIREENDEAIDAKFTSLVGKSLDQLDDRIDNGDHVVLRDGSVVRKPVGARDLALVTAINIDKRQLLRGKPTSRTESVTTEGRLANLAVQFAALAAKTAVKVPITNVESTEIETERLGDNPSDPERDSVGQV